MKSKAKSRLVLAAVFAALVVAWFIVPGPFGHGVIVGIVVAFASLIVAIKVFSTIMKKKMGGLKPPPLPTGTWDYVMDLSDLDGAAMSFAQSSGKVIVLNFWATWCAPCVAEMPSLAKLRDETADLDVQFGFITREEPPVVRQFIEKRGIDLPIYVLTGDPPECFTGRAIPATFVLDKTGMIAMRHFGAAAWDADSVVAFVRGLAAKPAH